MKIHEATIKYNVVGEMQADAIDTPEKAAQYVATIFNEDPSVEWMVVIILNRKNRPMGRAMITKGTASASLVHPREVFKPILLAGGSAFIALHNHPSGDPGPSAADVKITRQLREAAKIMDIAMHDHVIVGDPDAPDEQDRFYSFSDAGLI